MNKIPLSKLDIDVCHETLESGLQVYVVKKEDSNRNYIALTTRYGSDIVEFVPRGKHKMTKVPLGIAHFLEHQMFQMEDGSDPLEEFSKSGCDANAYTNNDQTCYLFSGVNDVVDNVKYLLKYVSEPYFTDETVEKEKGIIIEELKMYADNPDTVLYETILKNTIKELPTKYPVIGTINEIKKTTKEDLMTCYETFYHPSNMYLIVVGNIEPKEIIETARKSDFNQKHFNDKKEKVQIKCYSEPKKVVKEYEKKYLDVILPKVAMTFKLNIEQFSDIEKRKLYKYLSIFFTSKFGSSSLFLDQIRKDGVVKDILYIDHLKIDNYLLYMITTETKDYSNFIQLLKQEMENIIISEEEFERKRKVLISSYIYISDHVDSIANLLDNDIYEYNQVHGDWYQFMKDLSYEEMKKMLKVIDFTNYNTVVIANEEN